MHKYCLCKQHTSELHAHCCSKHIKPSGITCCMSLLISLSSSLTIHCTDSLLRLPHDVKLSICLLIMTSLGECTDVCRSCRDALGKSLIWQCSLSQISVTIPPMPWLQTGLVHLQYTSLFANLPCAYLHLTSLFLACWLDLAHSLDVCSVTSDIVHNLA